MPTQVGSDSTKPRSKRRRCKCCKCSAVLNLPKDPTVKKFQCSQCGALLQVSAPPTAPKLPARGYMAAAKKPRRLKLPFVSEGKAMAPEDAAREGCAPPRLIDYLARFGVVEEVYVAPSVVRRDAPPRNRRRRRRRRGGDRLLSLHQRYPVDDYPSTSTDDSAFPPQATLLGIAEIVREILRTEEATRAALSSASGHIFEAPRCFSLVTNDGAGRRRYVACFVRSYSSVVLTTEEVAAGMAERGEEPLPEDELHDGGQTLRCKLELICLFSHWPFVTAHEALLSHWAALFARTEERAQIEGEGEASTLTLTPEAWTAVVAQLVGKSVLPGGEGGVMDVVLPTLIDPESQTASGSSVSLVAPPLPLAGGTARGDVLRLSCQRPPAGTLPAVDERSFNVLLRHVRPASVVQMIGLALQGQSMLLISSDVSRLVPAAEALRTLLFPMQWAAPLVFAPVLSPAMLRTISATDAPYIGGVTSSCLAEVGMMERNPTIVKIDNGTMIPPIEAMDRLPPLPERLSKQLEMALQRACESSPIDVTAVRLACLRAVAKLLGRLFAVDPTQAREQELSEKRYDESLGAPFSTATALQPSRCRRSYKPFVQSVLEHSLLWSRYLDEYSGCTPITGERLAAIQFFEEFTMHEREVSRLRRETQSRRASAVRNEEGGGAPAPPKDAVLKLPGPSPRQLLFRYQGRHIASIELTLPGTQVAAEVEAAGGEAEGDEDAVAEAEVKGEAELEGEVIVPEAEAEQPAAEDADVAPVLPAPDVDTEAETAT